MGKHLFSVEGALVLLAALGTVAFAAFVAGARLEPATFGLALCAVALVHALGSLYRVVGALATTEADTLLAAQSLAAVATTRELREEKKRVLKAIKELDFDHEMGKISDDDHRQVRAGYERRAIEVIRSLEQDPGLHPELQRALDGGAAVSEVGDDDPSAREPAPPPVGRPPLPGEAGVPMAVTDPGPTAAGCLDCGSVNDPDAKFCKNCGVSLRG